MENDRTKLLRDKITRLGSELDSLSRAIKDEIDLHDRWSRADELDDREERAFRDQL